MTGPRAGSFLPATILTTTLTASLSGVNVISPLSEVRNMPVVPMAMPCSQLKPARIFSRRSTLKAAGFKRLSSFSSVSMRNTVCPSAPT